MKTIGILGGLGPESTVSYYTYITRKYYETCGDYAYPNIVIYSMSFRQIIDAGYDAPDEVRAAIGKLHRAGADFVIAACNSIHLVYDEVSRNIPIPWVSIMDVTAERIKKDRMTRVGLLGTVFTMGKGFYQTALARHGIEVITPDAESQEKVNEIIFGELVRNKVRPESKEFVLECIDALGQRSAEGVVLGCTELPFLIQQEDTRMPVYDSAAIHAQKALELAMAPSR